MNWGTLFFSFSGRINRAKYWLASVILLLVFAVLVVVAVSTMSTAAWILAGVAFIGVAVASLAVGAKRLHDRDKSAWWLLLFYLAPGVLGVLGEAAGGAGIVFHVLEIGISVWALVELGFLRGTTGPNSFGPDPLHAPMARSGGAHSVS